MARCEDCTHGKVCRKFCSHREILFDNKADERCGYFQSTASVAPRAEVAREIFEEIEKCMLHDLIPSIGVYKGSLELRIAELRKKYTEAEAKPPKGE